MQFSTRAALAMVLFPLISPTVAFIPRHNTPTANPAFGTTTRHKLTVNNMSSIHHPHTNPIFRTLEKVKTQHGNDSKSSLFDLEIEKTFNTIMSGGVAIVPSNVGYTLIAKPGKLTAARINELKANPKGKLLGMFGDYDAYQKVFGLEAPSSLTDQSNKDLCLSFVGALSPSSSRNDNEMNTDLRSLLLESGALSITTNKSAMWLNAGPVVDRLLAKMKQQGDIGLLLCTSCNVANDPSPKSESFDIEILDTQIKSRVNYITDIPHWSVPELDGDGSWLSAPVFDFDEGIFLRDGKDLCRAKSLLIQSNIPVKDLSEVTFARNIINRISCI